MHESLPEHFTHTPPSLPQFCLVLPVWQVVPLQHPAHDSASQMQAPPTQRCPVLQADFVPQPQLPVARQVSATREPRHEVHAAPALPHVVRVEGRQVSPSQQPAGQVLRVQVETATQTPPSAEQVEPEPHEVHERPPAPQSEVVLPVRQTPEAQQPAQFDGPHGSTHALLLHVVAQVAHATPPVPHAAAVVPVWQNPARQQPFGHEAALQPPRHAPPSQLPAPHDSHAAPPLPHARFVVAVTHVAPMQHPPGHDVGLHADAPHWPPLHAVAPQSEHARPPVPHVVAVCVITHWSPRQQPPTHDVGVH